MAKSIEPLPYFKWLWRDWRANRKVQRLSYVARGLYRDLLDEQWCEGSIPAKVEDLAEVCGCPIEVMSEHWDLLRGFFEEQENGSLVNAKLEKQRTADDAIRAERARAGKAGALAKMMKTREREANAEQLPEFAEVCHIAEQSRADTEQSISEQVADSENPLIGQEDMNLKNFKAEITAAGVKHGFKVTGYQQTWEDLVVLTKAHSSQAVINDFDAFLTENRGAEFNNVLTKYLYVAAERLLGEAPALAEVKSPALTNLNRELTYLSGGAISFIDKQKIKLAELLRDWTEEEVIAVFKEWLSEQDLNDPKNVQYLPGKFVQTADSRCYALRRSRAEKVSEGLARQRAVERLQEAANAERQEAERKRKEEEAQFNPIADLMS